MTTGAGRLRSAQSGGAHGDQECAERLLTGSGVRPGHARYRLATYSQGSRTAAPDGQQPVLQSVYQFRQRLPNGNTLITEGSGGDHRGDGDHQIIWEYISPYWIPDAHEHGLPCLPRALRVGAATQSAQGSAHWTDRCDNL